MTTTSLLLAWSGWGAAYLAVGVFVAGFMFCNKPHPPDMAETVFVVLFWPLLGVLVIVCAFFALGGMVNRMMS
jgi:hypothetical protein